MSELSLIVLCTYFRVGYYSYTKDVINSVISNIGVNMLKTSMP